jgi:hypothetical protein
MTCDNCRNRFTLIEGIEDPGFRRFLGLHVSAAKNYAAAQRCSTRAARVDLLFGDGAGLRDRANAQAHVEAYATLFTQASEALTELSASLANDVKERIDRLLADDGMRRFYGVGRASGLNLLAETEVSVSDAREAIERFDAELGRVDALQSVDQMTAYLVRRFEGLSTDVQAVEASETQNSFCLIFIWLTSIAISILLSLIFFCLFYRDCDLAAMFEAALAEICG